MSVGNLQKIIDDNPHCVHTYGLRTLCQHPFACGQGSAGTSFFSPAQSQDVVGILVDDAELVTVTKKE